MIKGNARLGRNQMQFALPAGLASSSSIFKITRVGGFHTNVGNAPLAFHWGSILMIRGWRGMRERTRDERSKFKANSSNPGSSIDAMHWQSSFIPSFITQGKSCTG